MACDISKGKALLACKDAVSGIKAIYLANYDAFVFTPGAAGASTEQEITDIAMPSGVTTSEFYKYEVKNSGNTFQQDIASNRDNGTTLFTQTLNVVLTKLSSEMEFQVKMMAWGRPQIVVEANSGDMILLGKEHGCEISGNSQIQGTMDALNGYTLTAVATEKDPIFYLQDAAKTQVRETYISTDNIA